MNRTIKVDFQLVSGEDETQDVQVSYIPFDMPHTTLSEGLSIQHISFDMLRIYYFSIGFKLLGSGFVNEMVECYKTPIPKNVHNTGDLAIFNTQMFLPDDRFISPTILNKFRECSQYFINPSSDTWLKFWEVVDEIYNCQDIYTTMLAYTSMIESFSNIFIFADPQDSLIFSLSRSIESLNNYLHSADKYKLLNMRKPLAYRSKLTPTVKNFIYFHRDGLSRLDFNSEDMDQIRNFVLTGKFLNDNTPPNILVSASHPEDGLLLRVLIPIIMLGKLETVDPNLLYNFEKKLHKIHSDSIKVFDRLIVFVRAIGLPYNQLLPIDVARKISPEISTIFKQIGIIITDECIYKLCENAHSHYKNSHPELF